MTHSRSSKINKVVENRETNIEETKVKFDKINNKILFQAFGKVTLKTKQFKQKEEINHTLAAKENRNAVEEWSNNGKVPEGWKNRNGVEDETWQDDDYLLEGWLFNNDIEEEQDNEKISKDRVNRLYSGVGQVTGPRMRGVECDKNEDEWQDDDEIPERRMNSVKIDKEWKDNNNLPEGRMDEDSEAARLLDIRNKRIEDGIQSLRESNQGCVGAVWKTSQELKGSKKGVEAVAIKDPETGKLVVSSDKIKRVSLKYCKGVLEKNPIKHGFKEEIEIKKFLHEIRMKEIYEDDDEIVVDEGTFGKIVEKFKKSKKRNYDLLVNLSDSFKASIFRFIKRRLEEEVYPKECDNTTLHQVFKHGSKNELSSFRYIHSKPWLSRTADAMVVLGPKEKILGSASTMQCGGLPGHRAAEHLFSMISVIGLYLAWGMPFLGQVFDLEKYFDKEVLFLVIDCLYSSSGVKGKEYRNIYQMSRRNRVRVRTGADCSEYEDAGELLAQGSGGAALYSQKYLDSNMEKMFTW